MRDCRNLDPNSSHQHVAKQTVVFVKNVLESGIDLPFATVLSPSYGDYITFNTTIPNPHQDSVCTFLISPPSYR